jgi:ectoine hydroxylase-related dioxygenase (phytanoyl-CoA dioxygenase family)
MICGQILDVAGSAGDLVIWDSFLPHGNGLNTNGAGQPRLCQYVNMWPTAGWASQPGQPLRSDLSLLSFFASSALVWFVPVAFLTKRAGV